MKKISAIILSIVILIGALCALNSCNTVRPSEDLTDGVETAQNIAEPGADYSAEMLSFTLRMLTESAQGNTNPLLSPVSVLSALAMTMNGADSNTLAQMEETFGIGCDELNSFFSTYMKSLPSGDKYKVNLANSIWFKNDEHLSINKSFLQTNTDFFGADVFKSPFNRDTVADINRWVNEKTHGMIPEIIDYISPMTAMYLINALSFEAEWKDIYFDESIKDGVFNAADGSKKKAEFMYSSELFLDAGNARGFMKYYKDNTYAFVAILPDEDVSVRDYISTLTAKKLKNMIETGTRYHIDTGLPKFEFQFEAELSAIIQSLGITDAFDENLADFSRMGTYNGNNIYVNKILHKTYIKIDSLGTKGGSASAVEMNCEEDTDPLDTPLIFDRPFVYLIVDTKYNIPLFIGICDDIGE